MKENKEFNFLIHLLDCALNEKTPNKIPKKVSLSKVYLLAEKHAVANVAFLAVSKLQPKPDAEILVKWSESFFKSIKKDKEQQIARNEIISKLHDNKIYTIEVQGEIVKKFYPKSYLRNMMDIDIVVDKKDFEKLPAVMEDLGYNIKYNDGFEINAIKKKIFVELHTEFFDPGNVTHQALNNPFSHAEKKEDYFACVSDTVFYLFHLLHTIKHVTDYKGAGIKRIIDLFYLETALKDKVDYEYINGILKKYGFYDVKEELIALKDFWFLNIQPKTDISKLINNIAEAGDLGTDHLLFKNKFEKAKREGQKFVKIKYFLRFIFPSKEIMYHSYPFCKKHRYPLVLCWLHRFFTLFNFKKLKNFFRCFSRLFVKTEKKDRN